MISNHSFWAAWLTIPACAMCYGPSQQSTTPYSTAWTAAMIVLGIAALGWFIMAASLEIKNAIEKSRS